MALSALNVLSGIAAAAAGLAGEKVSKDGSVPGLDLATIIPALLGSKTGGTGSNLLGTLASAAAKSGLLTSDNIGKLAELAGTLLTAKKAADTKATDTKAAGTKKSAAATISGQVVDKLTGEPLAGACVTAGSRAVYTDFDGNFSIEQAAGNTLNVSLISYEAQQVQANGSTLVVELGQ